MNLRLFWLNANGATLSSLYFRIDRSPKRGCKMLDHDMVGLKITAKYGA